MALGDTIEEAEPLVIAGGGAGSAHSTFTYKCPLDASLNEEPGG